MLGNMAVNWKSSFMNYMKLIRFFNPTGFLLVFYPCAFALILCATSLKDFLWSFYFLCGAFITRSLGCVVNDLMDRDIDNKVLRTKNRPIANGEVSVKEGIMLACIMAMIGFFMLLFVDTKLLFIGFPTAILIVLYPLQKRFVIPQFFLSAVFNVGIIFVSYVILGYLDERLLLLYLACFFWCIYYDLIYAHQDKDDDIYIGIKSLALTDIGGNKLFMFFLYSMFFVFLILCGYLYHISLLGISLLVMIFIYNIKRLILLNLCDRMSCWFHFRFQGLTVGFLVCLALFIGKI